MAGDADAGVSATDLLALRAQLVCVEAEGGPQKSGRAAVEALSKLAMESQECAPERQY